MAHATEVALNCAVAVASGKKHTESDKSGNEDQRRSAVAVRLCWGRPRDPVEEGHHASNHEQGRLLHRLRAIRVKRSWQLLAPDQESQDRDSEDTPSVPP